MASVEEIREESRIDIEYYVTKYKSSIYKEQHPQKGEDSNYWYLDQSPKYGMVSSFFTPWGIKQMESWYIDQIQKGYPTHTKEQMELFIKCNPHLHNIIKTNLLDNLQNAKRRN
jgi:hypothetical protein